MKCICLLEKIYDYEWFDINIYMYSSAVMTENSLISGIGVLTNDENKHNKMQEMRHIFFLFLQISSPYSFCVY